jgi:tetratricopeptide (TPR) repeat protein
LLAAVLILAAIVIELMPHEIARWRAAAAWERQLSGDLEGALRAMAQAIAWAPADAKLYCRRSSWRVEAGDYSGAVEDAERAVELAPRDPAGYCQRSEAYQYAGRRREAVEDWNKLVQLANGKDEIAVQVLTHRYPVDVFNGRAYARALANIELEAGLKDVERSIKRSGAHWALLDTRGYLHYLRGDLAAAREDLDLAVQLVEASLSSWKAKQAKRRRQEVDVRRLKEEREWLEKTTAVLRYHRSLVYDQLQLDSRAEADRRRVRQLGHEPTDALF